MNNKNYHVIIILLYSFLVGNDINEYDNNYLQNLLFSVGEIEIDHLLEYEVIAKNIPNEEDKSYFYKIIAIEFESRIEKLNKKYTLKKNIYIDKIIKYEEQLRLPSYCFDLETVNYNKNKLIKSRSSNSNRVWRLSRKYVRDFNLLKSNLKKYRDYYNVLNDLFLCNNVITLKKNLKNYRLEIRKISKYKKLI